MKFGVVVFPGSNCDQDCYDVIHDVIEQPVRFVWHEDTDLHDLDVIVLPGGFSYGDYLRTGAIARFSPVMQAIQDAVARGVNVIGICNGFQILLESGLLPGAMVRNRSLRFICRYVTIRVESDRTPFTHGLTPGTVLSIPIAHNEGNYVVDPDRLENMRKREQIIFRYCGSDGAVGDEWNPNGSIDHIAGICNEAGNVLGMMPHPERSSETILGSADGRALFAAVATTAVSSQRA